MLGIWIEGLMQATRTPHPVQLSGYTDPHWVDSGEEYAHTDILTEQEQEYNLYRVGVNRDLVVRCRSAWNGYVCTLIMDHPGHHSGGTTGIRTLARWDNDEDWMVDIGPDPGY